MRYASPFGFRYRYARVLEATAIALSFPAAFAWIDGMRWLLGFTGFLALLAVATAIEVAWRRRQGVPIGRHLT